MKITVGNLKGGVAKSTSSVHVALCLAAQGGRVLLVDADATNQTCLKWSTLAADWPASVVVLPWEVEDLAKRVKGVENDYDHIVIDTGPQKPKILGQALLVTDELLVPVAPSPVELEQLPDTFELAAKVDVISPVYPQVLLAKVRSGTRSSRGAREWLTANEIPVMQSEVRYLESYIVSYGTVPEDLSEYQAVLEELASAGGGQ